jgi:hypothetical protein
MLEALELILTAIDVMLIGGNVVGLFIYCVLAVIAFGAIWFFLVMD